MNRATEYRVGVGASSILMIFIILSLTTLGVLSFASGRADWTLSQRRTEQVTAYYEAAAEAEQLIARIDAVLFEAREADAFDYGALRGALEALDSRLSVSDEAAAQISFELPVGDTQALQIALSIHPDMQARYTLTRHSLVNIGQWVPDDSINLPTDPSEIPQENTGDSTDFLLLP